MPGARPRLAAWKTFVEQIVTTTGDTGVSPHRSPHTTDGIAAEPAQLHGFSCPVLSAVGRQIGPGVARLGVGQGLLVPIRVARSWEAEHRPLPGRGPLDDLEPV